MTMTRKNFHHIKEVSHFILKDIAKAWPGIKSIGWGNGAKLDNIHDIAYFNGAKTRSYCIVLKCSGSQYWDEKHIVPEVTEGIYDHLQKSRWFKDVFCRISASRDEIYIGSAITIRVIYSDPYCSGYAVYYGDVSMTDRVVGFQFQLKNHPLSNSEFVNGLRRFFSPNYFVVQFVPAGYASLSESISAAESSRKLLIDGGRIKITKLRLIGERYSSVYEYTYIPNSINPSILRLFAASSLLSNHVDSPAATWDIVRQTRPEKFNPYDFSSSICDGGA